MNSISLLQFQGPGTRWLTVTMLQLMEPLVWLSGTPVLFTSQKDKNDSVTQEVADVVVMLST